MSNTNYIHNKLTNNEIVYLYEDLREVIVRIVPQDDKYICYAKYSGKDEFLIDGTAKIVTDAELGGDIITKEEYEKF